MPKNMQKRLKPTGFVARCQCGVYVAALDANQTEPKEMSRLLGEWLFNNGYTVEPRFAGTWCETIKPCQCTTG